MEKIWSTVGAAFGVIVGIMVGLAGAAFSLLAWVASAAFTVWIGLAATGFLVGLCSSSAPTPTSPTAHASYEREIHDPESRRIYGKMRRTLAKMRSGEDPHNEMVIASEERMIASALRTCEGMETLAASACRERFRGISLDAIENCIDRMESKQILVHSHEHLREAMIDECAAIFYRAYEKIAAG